MRPTQQYQFDHLNIDINALSFLLDSGEPQMLFDLLLEDDKFKTTIQIVNARSKLHWERVQPKLEEAGIEQGIDYPVSRYKTAIGDLLFFSLKGATDDMVQFVDDTIESLELMGNKLRSKLTELYPDTNFIDFASKIEEEEKKEDGE